MGLNTERSRYMYTSTLPIQCHVVLMHFQWTTNIMTVFAVDVCSIFNKELHNIQVVRLLGCIVEWSGLWDNMRWGLIHGKEHMNSS